MVSFVILHYKNMKDTLECIASIRKMCMKESYSIIVVDNVTLSESEKEILLQETPDVLCNEENIGFAKGNNVGIRYAISTYHPDFLVVLNSDIVLLQPDFISRIQSCYQETSFDFMGPKILTDGGESVNPFPVYRTLQEVNRAISKSKKLIFIYHSRILSFLLSCYMSIKRKIRKPKHLQNGTTSCYDIAVHGCCIVFSKSYYQRYEDVFYPETFLYHEEEFLEFRRVKDHLISFYDATIEVFHKEGASLNQAFENQERKKLIFRNQAMVRSLSLLKQLMKEHKEL